MSTTPRRKSVASQPGTDQVASDDNSNSDLSLVTGRPCGWITEEARHSYPPKSITRQPVEDLFLVLRHCELLVKRFRTSVALVSGPLDTTALMLDRHLT